MDNPGAILLPFFGLMALTGVVWIYMYYRRLSFILGNKIPPQDLTTPERAQQLLPEKVQYPANNLRNLLQLPLIFYVLCLYLYGADKVDTTYVTAAWLFVAGRVAHSAIHCTVNRVQHRFYAYFVSALVLWFMVGRAVIGVFSS